MLPRVSLGPYLEPLSVCTYWDMSETLASARDTLDHIGRAVLRGAVVDPRRDGMFKPDKPESTYLPRVEIIRQVRRPIEWLAHAKGRERGGRENEKLFRFSADRAHIV